MKKKAILKLGILILIAYLFKPDVIYSQSSCQTSIQLSQQTNYQLTSVQASDTVIWASFIATSAGVMCIADSVSGFTYNKVKKIELYQGDCNSKVVIEASSNFESNTMQSLYFGQLIIGNSYLIRYTLENANSNYYTGITATVAATSGYNWDEDNDCPCNCNIIKNHNFDIENTVNTHDKSTLDGASPFLNGNVCGWHTSWGSPCLRSGYR